MTIRELQKRLTDALNGVEELVQGGCKAFAEDTRTVYEESQQWISGGKVAIVVVTPDMTRNGSNFADGSSERSEAEGATNRSSAIPADTQLMIRCVERAPLAHAAQTLRALDAAEIVMHALDGEDICWLSTRQTADPKRETITATATFATTITFTA